jgi:hypothetical protein
VGPRGEVPDDEVDGSGLCSFEKGIGGDGMSEDKEHAQ